MGRHLRGKAALLATIMTAALACLQPGIDPVFLTLLSAAHAVDPADHGWIVGATQAGMAIGSLLVWRLGSGLPRALFPIAALLTLLASLATAWSDETAALLLIRGGYGLAMGMLYTRAMSAAAGWRPNGAYGAVFLVQLLLSTLVALALPWVADVTSPALALATLALGPLLTLLCLTLAGRPGGHAAPAAKAGMRHRIDPPAWALATGSLLFICATMMVWSFTGALAMNAHIPEEIIGRAVALGSIAGALTAVIVMRETLFVPLPLTGLLAGLSLLAPIPGAASGDGNLFILSVVLLNIGSTAIIIRCSGMASARSTDPLFARLVASTHPLGMILGPIAGSILAASFGESGLLGGAMVTIAAGCASLLVAALWERGSSGGRSAVHEGPAEFSAKTPTAL